MNLPALAAAPNDLRIETREQLFYTLTEAAELEHNLMCCYLYAAFSLRSGDDDGLEAGALTDVRAWRRAIVGVAVEEMSHLALVSNLFSALGATPHLARPNFPIAPGYHPAGVHLHLAPFTPATLQHFVHLERPVGSAEPDGEGFGSPRAYQRGLGAEMRLMPSGQDYETVGHLYRAVARGVEGLARRHGAAALFVGDPAAQIGPELVSLPGLSRITDLESAVAAVETIVRQGEGAYEDTATGHYQRLVTVRAAYDARRAAEPDFVPARPAAVNPVMRRPPDPEGRVWIEAPPAAAVLDLGNALYGQMLRLLAQGFAAHTPTVRRSVYLDAAISLMFSLGPVGEHLTTLPARPDGQGPNAGLTFSMLRPAGALASDDAATTVLAQRFDELAEDAERLAAKLGGARLEAAAVAARETARAFVRS